MSQNIQEIEIQELIPQRHPIIMVDKLISSDDSETVSKFKVLSNNIFCKEGYFKEPGLIENIAQTAAARAGYIFKQQNKEIPVGFIGGIKNLQIHQLPEINTELITTVKIVTQIFNATIIEGNVKDIYGHLFANCEMKIFTENN